MMNRRSVAVWYALFALVATGANVGAQRAVLQIARGPLALYAAVATGTLVGLGVKYVLDCRWIFAYVHRPAAESLVTFTLYGLMSGITTIVFWVAEFLFDALFASGVAKYIGAVLGLGLGYTLKYQLDRRFVFRRRRFS